jgi:hypothetical protein
MARFAPCLNAARSCGEPARCACAGGVFGLLALPLGEEVETLRIELNVTLPAEIARAVEMGDLRENSEYKAALERQRLVQARLGQLTMRLSKLSQIDITLIPTDRVGKATTLFFRSPTCGPTPAASAARRRPRR